MMEGPPDGRRPREYGLGDIRVLHALETIPRIRHLFFPPDGAVNPVRLLAWLMSDVLVLGRGECRIVEREQWFVVASDVDWLQHDALSVPELFRNLVPAPAHGDNACRAEVLVAVFATDVFTVDRADTAILKGEAPTTETRSFGFESGWARRSVGFRMREAVPPLAPEAR